MKATPLQCQVKCHEMLWENFLNKSWTQIVFLHGGFGTAWALHAIEKPCR